MFLLVLVLIIGNNTSNNNSVCKRSEPAGLRLLHSLLKTKIITDPHTERNCRFARSTQRPLGPPHVFAADACRSYRRMIMYNVKRYDRLFCSSLGYVSCMVHYE